MERMACERSLLLWPCNGLAVGPLGQSGVPTDIAVQAAERGSWRRIEVILPKRGKCITSHKLAILGTRDDMQLRGLESAGQDCKKLGQ